MALKDIVYKAPKTLQLFHKSKAFVRLVLGAIGSGKSVGMCAEMVRLACTQEPSKDGIRYTRFAVVRNTQKELTNTTIKTLLDWYGDLGTFHKSDLTFHLKFNDVDCEIMCMGLDRPDQLKSLLSLELSGAFINEAREVQPEVILTIMSRLGRYPSMRDDVGCTDPRLFMDSNFPSEDSFLYEMFEEERPEGWELFKQPSPMKKDGSGVRKKAENIENLPKGYYTTQMAGQKADWLAVHRDCKYAFLMDGKPVFPEFIDNYHVIDDWTPDTKKPIYLGLDYGRTPVAVFGQKDSSGRLVVFDELQCWNMGAEKFGTLLKEKLNTEYPEYELAKGYGDPAGDDMGQNDDNTPMLILNKLKLPIVKSPTQDPYVRVEAVRSPLDKNYNGLPAFRLTKKCKMLRKSMAGGYLYKRIQVSGTPRYGVKPDKNEYSHVNDALQYLMCGLGYATELIRRSDSDFNKKAKAMNAELEGQMWYNTSKK